MKLKEFNSQSLLQKERYIQRFVSGNPFISGVLVFENYRILTLYSVGGDLLECEAYPHDDQGREEALMLLNGEVCVGIDCSNWPGVKESISKKLMKASGQLN